MANTLKMQRALDRFRTHIVHEHMPDTCRIKVRGAPVSTTVFGAVVYSADTYRQYKGLIDIPCRLDASRALRPDRLPAQPNVANEFYLFLPVEVGIEGTDEIEINGLQPMKIKKIVLHSEADVVREIVLSEFEL